MTRDLCACGEIRDDFGACARCDAPPHGDAGSAFGTRLSPLPAALVSSPWGEVDEATMHAPGVFFVSTPGHGGFLVSSSAWHSMPSGLAGIGTRWGQFYAFEEDCAYAAVVASFPESFAPASVEVARGMLRSWYPEHADGGAGCGVSQPVGASFHRCRR